MPRTHCLRVTAQVRDIEMCAEYGAATGRLRLLRDGAVLRRVVSTELVDCHRVGERRPQLANTP